MNCAMHKNLPFLFSKIVKGERTNRNICSPYFETFLSLCSALKGVAYSSNFVLHNRGVGGLTRLVSKKIQDPKTLHPIIPIMQLDGIIWYTLLAS